MVIWGHFQESVSGVTKERRGGSKNWKVKVASIIDDPQEEEVTGWRLEIVANNHFRSQLVVFVVLKTDFLITFITARWSLLRFFDANEQRSKNKSERFCIFFFKISHFFSCAHPSSALLTAHCMHTYFKTNKVIKIEQF